MDQTALFSSILNNCLAYLNFNAFFEFLGQLTKGAFFFFIFQEGVDKFEIEHKTN